MKRPLPVSKDPNLFLRISFTIEEILAASEDRPDLTPVRSALTKAQEAGASAGAHEFEKDATEVVAIAASLSEGIFDQSARDKLKGIAARVGEWKSKFYHEFISTQDIPDGTQHCLI